MASDRGGTLGRAVWHDLLTTDVGKAVRFYSELLEWQIEPPASGDTEYRTIEAAGRRHGGVAPLDAGSEVGSHWLAYVPADDVDHLANRAVALGGRAVGHPADLPAVGRVAALRDPQGAEIAVLSSGEGQAPDGVFLWDELMTTELDDAQRFYRGLFGWSCFEDHVGPSGTYRFFKLDDENVAGLMEKPYYLAQPLWMTYLAVEDVDVAAGRVLDLGGTIAVEPTDIFDIGRFGVAVDPTEAAFGIYKAA